MEYRHVGRSELVVSALGLGGWRTLGGQLGASDSSRLLDVAFDAGVTLIDLADSYAHGGAETAVGKWLAGKPRDKLVLTSKVFWPTGPGEDDRGLGRKHIANAIDASLRRLGTDYLDIYFCHREDPDTPLGETIEALNRLVEVGKIRHWGTSMWHPKTLLKAQLRARMGGMQRPVVEQCPYNLLKRWVERRTLPLCRWLGMGSFVFSPLAQGLLSGKYTRGVPEGSRAALDDQLRAQIGGRRGEQARRFVQVAERLGVEPPALALSWLLRRRGVTCVLMGASRVEQLQQNLTALDVSIPTDAMRELDAL